MGIKKTMSGKIDDTHVYIEGCHIMAGFFPRCCEFFRRCKIILGQPFLKMAWAAIDVNVTRDASRIGL